MAWLSGYTYRKAITLSRASGTVTNYQMKLLVGESSGATGEDVDCAAHVQADFDDLRFTTSDGTTLLDYWIESVTGSTPNCLATVWIEFDSIGTGATTFYMYYGYASAVAVSSGANTFIVFDDFERGADGDTVGGSWTEDAVHCHISTDQDIGNVAGFFGTRSLKLLGQASIAAKASIAVSASANIAIRYRYYKETACAFVLQHGDQAGSNDLSFYMDASEDVRVYDGATFVDTTLNCLADSWGYVDIHNFNWSGGTVDVEVDGNTKTGCDITYASAGDDGKVRFYGGPGANVDAWVDNFIVRNYRATEPAWGAWGGEEVEIQGNISLSVSPGSTSIPEYVCQGAVSLSLTPQAANIWDYILAGAIPVSLLPEASVTGPTAGYEVAGNIGLSLIPSSVVEYIVQQILGDILVVLIPQATQIADYPCLGAIDLLLLLAAFVENIQPDFSYEFMAEKTFPSPGGIYDSEIEVEKTFPAPDGVYPFKPEMLN